MEDRERKSRVQNHTRQARNHTRVEAHHAALGHDVSGHAHEAELVAASLHLGLDHVNRVVKHDAAEAGEATRNKIAEHLGGNVVLQELLSVSEHDKAHSLVGRLFQDSGHHTLVEASDAGLRRDAVDSLEDVLVLGRGGELIVNKLGLERLLRGHNHNGLGEAGEQAACKGVHLVFLREEVGLSVLEGTEADRVLGHGEEQQGRVTTVEAENAVASHGLSRETHHAESRLGLIDLHDSLQVLSGVSARDLDGADDTA